MFYVYIFSVAGGGESDPARRPIPCADRLPAAPEGAAAQPGRQGAGGQEGAGGGGTAAPPPAGCEPLPGPAG